MRSLKNLNWRIQQIQAVQRIQLRHDFPYLYMQMRSPIKFIAVILVLILGIGESVAQSKTKVKLIDADELLMDDNFDPDIQRLIGNVVMLHDSTYFYCDSAWLNRKENNFRAFHNVHINVSDTLDIYSDSLNYDEQHALPTSTAM